MVRRPRHVAVLAAVLLALAAALLPATALACAIAIRTIGPIDGSRADLVTPVARTVTREAWELDSSWVSTRPRLSQFVRVEGLGRFHAVSFKEQRSLSIDAYGPFDNGWMYFDGNDSDGIECALTGKIEWQQPKIRVVQGAREIRIAATAQRTVGSRDGCILGPDLGVRECPNLKRTIVGLTAPVGNRKIVFEQFS